MTSFLLIINLNIIIAIFCIQEADKKNWKIVKWY